MYWKNFSTIVATFVLVGPLVGTAFVWLLFFSTGNPLAGLEMFMFPIIIGFSSGLPFAFLTGAIFAFLALSHGKRQLLYAWLSALVANVCITTIYYAAIRSAEPSGALVAVRNFSIAFLIPSLAASTISWLLATRWLDATPIVTAPKRADL